MCNKLFEYLLQDIDIEIFACLECDDFNICPFHDLFVLLKVKWKSILMLDFSGNSETIKKPIKLEIN
jgi:hypothetical protein